jgi:outer membrane protein assembly factor BamB/TolA-binding protein
MLILLFLPALALAQAQTKEQDKDKVSNDNPARPLQMPPASTEAKDAFDDFERFQRRGAWERALKALYAIPEDQALRFVDGESGFIIPVARKRRLVLAALPPEGQAAYRLFFDPTAQKLYQEAEGAAELPNLERIYSAYFVTSVGDNAADRLGDLYFELGRFDRAAECYLAVLRDRPDTDLAPGALAVKAALALARAGRRSEFEQMRDELTSRYGDDKVSLAGMTAAPTELLRRLMGDEKGTSDAGRNETASHAETRGPDLSGAVDVAWQVRFADTVEAGMTPPEKIQWEQHPLSSAVPSVAIHGTTLYANYLGYIFAVDLKSGKMLWRSEAFHHLEVPARQDFTRGLDPARYAIVASEEYLWTLVRDLKDPNFQAPFTLVCRRADTGETIWKSPDLADYAQLDFVGQPLLADGKLFVAAKPFQGPQRQGPPQEFLLAIQPHDGKLLWKTEIGTFRGGVQFYFFSYRRDTAPQPRLLQRGGAVYIDTHVGVLGRLDAESGALEWGYGYKTDPYQSSYNFWFWYYEPEEAKPQASAPQKSGDAFLVKGAESDRLYAMDPSRMKVLWERPITKTSRLLGVDERRLYLGGAELSAVDLKTRALVWATRLPGDSMQGSVLVCPEGLWQLTPRGIFEIDPASGTVRRIFRGKDLGAIAGDLIQRGQWLLATSSRTITAYPRSPAPARVAAAGAHASNEKPPRETLSVPPSRAAAPGESAVKEQRSP